MNQRNLVKISYILCILIFNFLGYYFHSMDFMLYAFVLQTSFAIMMLDKKMFLFQLVVSLADIFICSIIGLLGYRVDYLSAHIIFGFICYLAAQCIGWSVISMFTRQNKVMREQEQSMDDMLRLFLVKCHGYREDEVGKLDFWANMSHEIRNPVNTIMGMNEMILQESDEPAIQEYAKSIYEAGGDLITIVDDILDFSKIEAKKMEIMPNSYNVFSLLQDIVSVTKDLVKDKRLFLNLDIDENIPAQLYGDNERIKQILVNLLSNAVKYTNEGSITLKMRAKKLSDYKISLYCEVKDSGIGIKEETIPLLFTAYRDIEQKKKSIRGTGLGIAIVSRLLEAMDSELRIESEYGSGSRFFFELVQDVVEEEPIGDLHGKFDEQEKEDGRYSLGLYVPDAKILVVDDNEINRKVFCNLLKKTGIQISQADSGRKCLEMVKQERFDIIFLDHMMPGMDGVQTLHAIRDGENCCQDVPIVVLTANAIEGARDHYLQEGFDDYLAKPVSSNRLEQMVQDLLPEELAGSSDGAVKPENAVPEPPDKNIGLMMLGLPEIDGIFWGYALSHFPDEEMLLRSVEDFYHMIPSSADKLQEIFEHVHEEGRLEEYMIAVHGMKSAAALIGAMRLNGCAGTLEMAAIRSIWPLIDVLTPIFLDDWRGHQEKLRPLIKSENDRQKKERKKDDMALGQILSQISSAADVMDLDTMDQGSEELDEYVWPKEFEEQMKELQVSVTNLDTDRIQELIREIKKGMDL